MPYLNDQIEFYNKKPSNIAQYNTVEFAAEDIDTIRLVANQTFDKQFLIDGTLQTFRGVQMQMPDVTNQNTSESKGGTLYFGQIANEMLPILKGRNPLLSGNPITATLRQFKENTADPISEIKMFVPKDGITYDGENVNIRLAIDNPAKLSLPNLFYDPDVWVGLKLT